MIERRRDVGVCSPLKRTYTTQQQLVVVTPDDAHLTSALRGGNTYLLPVISTGAGHHFWPRFELTAGTATADGKERGQVCTCDVIDVYRKVA